MGCRPLVLALLLAAGRTNAFAALARRHTCLPLDNAFAALRFRHPHTRTSMTATDGDHDDDYSRQEFSKNSMEQLANRLNGMLGLPQDPAVSRRKSTRGTTATTIPFVEEHFPSRTQKPDNAIARAVREFAKSLQEIPRIELSIKEDDEAYTVVCRGSGVDAVGPQVTVDFDQGVLMLALEATKGEATMELVVPVPLPADAASEVMQVAHGGTEISVKVAKIAGGAKAGEEQARLSEELGAWEDGAEDDDEATRDASAEVAQASKEATGEEAAKAQWLAEQHHDWSRQGPS